MNRRQFIQTSFAGLGLFTLPSWATQSDLGQTGVVLDPSFYLHDHKEHPENAKRLTAIDRALTDYQLWEKLTPITARAATPRELEWVHDSNYIAEIDLLSQSTPGYYDEYQPDTYFNNATFQAATVAAGSHIELNLAVYDRTIQNGFALLRPPGHHALKNKAMGFCIFNSDVIAAKALQQYRGIKKVAIIDFDVHHGNGTQDLTYSDPSIMAISIHQHPYWPMTGSAKWQGKGKAFGTNLNCPLPKGAGDLAYLQVFQEIIKPKLIDFKPEQIIAFAGYDAHWQDPLAEHRVSINGFNQLVSEIKILSEQLCKGRLTLSLGGGYLPDQLGQAVSGSLYQLLNQTAPTDDFGKDPTGEIDVSKAIDYLKQVHQL